MANPYIEVSVAGYNDNPPTDNGAASAANQIKWSTIKERLADPIKAALDTLDDNVKAAFAKMFGVAALVTSGSDLEMTAAHRGQTIVFTGSSNRTLALADATTVGAGFVVCVRNGSAGTLTIEAAEATPAQSVNGAASLTLGPGDGGLLVCDGSKFDYVGNTKDVIRFEADTAQLFFNTSAPTGWVKDTSFDDAAITLTSGAVSDSAGNAFSAVMANDIMIAAVNLPNMTLHVIDEGHEHGIYAPTSKTTDAGTDNGLVKNVWQNNTSSSTSLATTGIAVAIDDTSRGGVQQAMDFSIRHSKAIRAKKA